VKSAYLCWADDGGQSAEDAAPYEANSASDAAEACAEREHSESAGENHYPIEIHVRTADGTWSVWSVAIDYSVSFVAKPKQAAR
jgi:chitodextrinase